MLRFRKPPLSLVALLLVVIGLGAAVGQLVSAFGLALICFFVASIDPKPAWNLWYRKLAPNEMRRPPDIRN